MKKKTSIILYLLSFIICVFLLIYFLVINPNTAEALEENKFYIPTKIEDYKPTIIEPEPEIVLEYETEVMYGR